MRTKPKNQTVKRLKSVFHALVVQRSDKLLHGINNTYLLLFLSMITIHSLFSHENLKKQVDFMGKNCHNK